MTDPHEPSSSLAYLSAGELMDQFANGSLRSLALTVTRLPPGRLEQIGTGR